MKQETLEEVAENYVDSFEFGIAHPRRVCKNAFINGAKWQKEQDKNKYSEEEVLQLLLRLKQTEYYDNLYDWFEQFKKK